jgi:hypothetical protein
VSESSARRREFSCVRVADERNHAERNGLASAAARGALAAHGFDRLFDFADSIANAAAVGFEFLFARSACADTAAQSRQLFVASRQARQQIVELREFHLQLAFARTRVHGKNVEDELGAVDHTRADALLHVA